MGNKVVAADDRVNLEELCDLCNGTGVVTTSDPTGQEIYRTTCPKCLLDPEEDDEKRPA